MAWTSSDKAAKTLINRRATSSVKASYEELGDRTINVHLDEVWVQSVPTDPSQAVIDGAAEQRTLFTLTEDTSVANHQCYYAYDTGNRLRDWISDKYGTGYAIHLYQSTGAEIFPTDSSGWAFDYTTGILTLNSTTGLSLPLKISGYRYVGSKGITGIADTPGTPSTGVGIGVTGTINVYISSPGTITAGPKSDIKLPYGMHITNWSLFAGQTGTVYIDLWKSTFDNYPPTVAGSMHAGATGPCIVGGIKSSGTTNAWYGATGAYTDIIRVSVGGVSEGTLSAYLALDYYRT